MFRVEVENLDHERGDNDWAPVFNLDTNDKKFARFATLKTKEGEFESLNRDVAFDFAAAMAKDFPASTYRVVKTETKIEVTRTPVAYVTLHFQG